MVRPLRLFFAEKYETREQWQVLLAALCFGSLVVSLPPWEK